MFIETLTALVLAVSAVGYADDGAKSAKPHPYPFLKGCKQAGCRFEPSAVAYDEATKAVYVLSDKENHLHKYDINDIEGMGATAAPDRGDIGELALPEKQLKKFEALTRLSERSYLASTAFVLGTDTTRNAICRFRVDQRGKVADVKPVCVDACLSREVMRRFADGRKYAQIEGIAVCDGPKQDEICDQEGQSRTVFLGIREFHNFDETVKEAKDVKQVVLLVRSRLLYDGKKWMITGPFGYFDFTVDEDSPDPATGLSDVQRDEDGSYLILTSREEKHFKAKRYLPRETDHSGALYRVPSWVLEGPECRGSFHLGRPIRTFIAKSEGIAVVNGKGPNADSPPPSYIAVFDDDHDGWKELYAPFYKESYGAYEYFSIPPGDEPSRPSLSTPAAPACPTKPEHEPPHPTSSKPAAPACPTRSETASSAEQRFVKLKYDYRAAVQRCDPNAMDAARKAIREFVVKMPKGGLLHAHMTGEYSSDEQMDFARKNGFYIRKDSDQKEELTRKDGSKLGRDCDYKIISPGTYCSLSDDSRGHFMKLKDWAGTQEGRKCSGTLFTMQDCEPITKFFYTIFDRKDEIEDYPGAEKRFLTEVLERYHEENIGYVELRINAFHKGADSLVAARAYVEKLHGIVEEFNTELIKKDQSNEVVEVRFIVQVFRDFTARYRSPSSHDHDVHQAFALAASDDDDDDLIVGVDLIGWEHEQPEAGAPTDFLDALAMARQRFPGVHLTLHAGESNNRTMNVRDSILLGAERIGHGLNLIDDSFHTMDLAKRRSVLIEVCLHSNHLLYHRPIKDHPFGVYLKNGMLLSLNTDNRGVFEKDLSDEFVDAILAFNLSWSKLEELCRNSIAYGFMSRDHRPLIMKRWRDRWSKFECNPN